MRLLLPPIVPGERLPPEHYPQKGLVAGNDAGTGNLAGRLNNTCPETEQQGKSREGFEGGVSDEVGVGESSV
jgi:hypothetical protein